MKLVRHGNWSYSCARCNRKLRVAGMTRDHFNLVCPGCGGGIKLPRHKPRGVTLFPTRRRKDNGE